MKIYQSYSLKKRENGFWYVGYIVNDKKHWITTKCKKKPEAILFLKNFTDESVTPTSDLLLSDLFNQLKNSKKLRTTTLRCYNTSITKFKKLCGDKYISDYKLNDLERFKQINLDNKVSDTTTNIYMRSIISVFSYGVKNNYLKENPFSFSQLIKVQKITPVFISQDEFNILISKVTDETLKDFFITSANTGMRLSELVNLKWLNINFEKKQIVVTNTDEFTTKSGKSRVIPMNDLVLSILSKRFEQRNNTEYVFNKNGYRYNTSYISHKFKKYVVKANLNSKYHIHSLRHSFASWLALREVPIFSIQQLLGHSSVNTTLQYSHLSSSGLHSVVNKL
jgi:integrase